MDEETEAHSSSYELLNLLQDSDSPLGNSTSITALLIKSGISGLRIPMEQSVARMKVHCQLTVLKRSAMACSEEKGCGSSHQKPGIWVL
jgi:hypothetical protein